MSDSARLRIHVQPGAARSQIVGPHGDAIKIKVSAPPEDGKANAAIEALIADVLGVAKRSVQVVAGHSSRRKTVAVEGMSTAAAEAALLRAASKS